MSIIRQRRKNLMMSALLGFMIGALILTAATYAFRVPLADWLNISAEEEKVEIILETAIVAARPIEKGRLIEGDDLKIIKVDAATKVSSYFTDIESLIGKKTAIDLDENMPVTPPMFIDDLLIEDNLRLFEVSFVELPYHLACGEVVDIRIAFPTGQEYVVLSKKEVRGFERRSQNLHEGLLNLALDEEEALRMSSALVDMYIAEGARVYMVKYVDSDNQVSAVVNYPVNESVYKLLFDNPNIIEASLTEAMLIERIELNTSLNALLDKDNQPVYKVDMTTPDLSLNDELQESLSVEEKTKVESVVSVPTTEDASTNDDATKIGF